MDDRSIDKCIIELVKMYILVSFRFCFCQYHDTMSSQNDHLRPLVVLQFRPNMRS